MKITGLLIVAFILFAAPGFRAQTNAPVYRLGDVKKVFVDESSFRIVFSSCGTRAGGMLLPCAKHSNQRLEFLIVLKRWIGKSGFTIVEDEADADGILRGDMSMNDYANTPSINDRNRKNKRDLDPIDQAQWDINAWLVNQDGDRIWTIRRDIYPEISYGISTKAKVEGKKLAKAIQYDFKKRR